MIFLWKKKIVNGKQIITVFYVDYMKVSHCDHQYIEIFAEWSKQKH